MIMALRKGAVALDFTFLFQVINMLILIGLIVLIYKVVKKYLSNQTLMRELAQCKDELEVCKRELEMIKKDSGHKEKNKGGANLD